MGRQITAFIVADLPQNLSGENTLIVFPWGMEKTTSLKDCASYGYKRGYKQAADAVKEIAALFDNPDVMKATGYILEQLEEFSASAHDEFVKSLRVVDLTDMDSSTRQ